MFNLYKIPGLFICAFVGKFGTGKTLSLLEQALKVANAFDLDITSNFFLNSIHVKDYARRKNLTTFLARFHTVRPKSLGLQPQVLNYTEDLKILLSARRSVILFDEAGINFFTREFAARGRSELIQWIFQVRKLGSILLYTCQSIDQIDKQLRQMTDQFILCNAFQKFDIKLKHSRLIVRNQIAYDRIRFEEYLEKAKFKWIRPLALSDWRFSTDVLFISKLFAQINSFIFCFKRENQNLRKKALQRNKYITVFWWLHYFSEVYCLKYKQYSLTDTELLFMCYSSFSVVKKHKSSDSKITIDDSFRASSVSEPLSEDFLNGLNGHNPN